MDREDQAELQRPIWRRLAEVMAQTEQAFLDREKVREESQALVAWSRSIRMATAFPISGYSVVSLPDDPEAAGQQPHAPTPCAHPMRLRDNVGRPCRDGQTARPLRWTWGERAFCASYHSLSPRP